MHQLIDPSILYFGTPVVVISTLNQDGSINVAPMSSIWWLGNSAMLGLDASSQSTINIRRTGECVLNLASSDNVEQVDRLALMTGCENVPLHKQYLGYRFEGNKLESAGLTTTPSIVIKTPRIAECPIQLEVRVEHIRQFGKEFKPLNMSACSVELDILTVHVEEGLRLKGHENRIDPLVWKPLIMNFRNFLV